MQTNLKKANLISYLSVAIFPLVIVSLLFLTIGLLNIGANPIVNPSNRKLLKDIFDAIGGTMFVSAWLLAIFCAIFMFSVNWQIRSLNQAKYLLGVLTILPLGPIASLIFGQIAKTELKLHLYNNHEQKTRLSKAVKASSLILVLSIISTIIVISGAIGLGSAFGGLINSMFKKAIWIPSALLFLGGIIMWIIIAIYILVINWQVEAINKSKLLWGLLALLPLGPIAGIIFGTSASTKLDKHLIATK